MTKQYTDKERLLALLTALECQNIEQLMTKSPDLIKRVGEQITIAAKFGAKRYKKYREKHDING